MDNRTQNDANHYTLKPGADPKSPSIFDSQWAIPIFVLAMFILFYGAITIDYMIEPDAYDHPHVQVDQSPMIEPGAGSWNITGPSSGIVK